MTENLASRPSNEEHRAQSKSCAKNRFNIPSLNISIGQCGSVAINLKFETGQDLKNFEAKPVEFFSDLKKTFFKQSNFSGVFVYNYYSEIMSTDLSLN